MNLGHHSLGDYHFFVKFTEGAGSLGQLADETFLTHESFVSLVSAVHESYHVFQSLVTGAGCAVVDAEDHFIEAFRRAISSGSETDWMSTRLLSTGADYLRNHFYTATDSEYLFQRAERRSPNNVEFLTGLSKLTTTDLLECQAALLTEIYISRFMKARPQALDMQVIEDVAEHFRLEKMADRYRLPLDYFRARIQRLMTPADFEIASRSHPLSEQCPNIAEYVLLGFLLDYALHIPPPVVEEIRFDLDVYREDFDPPVRFAKLLEALLADMFQAQFGLASPELPEVNFYDPYSSLSPRLAKWIDIGDLLARSKANGIPLSTVPLPQQLFPLKREEILTSLKLQEAPITFPPFSVVTERWLDLYRQFASPQDLYRLAATRSVALQIRASQPDVWVWRPLDFFSEIGLPTFFDTPTGLAPGPLFQLSKRMKKEEYDRKDLDWRRFSMISEYRAPDSEYVTLTCNPGTAYSFLDQVIWREILFRACQSAFHQTPMTCSLAAGRFKDHPCDARGSQCVKIGVPDQLPPRPGCIARALYETYVQGAK